MLALWITLAVVLPILGLVFFVVCRTRPGRFKLSATVVKLLSINIEVDAQDKPDEPPSRNSSGRLTKRP